MSTSICLTNLTSRTRLEVFQLLNERVSYEFDDLEQKIHALRQSLYFKGYLSESLNKVLWLSDYSLITSSQTCPDLDLLELFECNCNKCLKLPNGLTFKNCGEKKYLQQVPEFQLEDFLKNFKTDIRTIRTSLIVSQILLKGELNGLGDIYHLARFMAMTMTGHVLEPNFKVKFPLCGCGNCVTCFNVRWTLNESETHVCEDVGMLIAVATYKICGKPLKLDFPWANDWFSNVEGNLSDISSHNEVPQTDIVLNTLSSKVKMSRRDLRNLFLNPVKQFYNKKYGTRNMMTLVMSLKGLKNLGLIDVNIKWHTYKDKHCKRKSDIWVQEVLDSCSLDYLNEDNEDIEYFHLRQEITSTDAFESCHSCGFPFDVVPKPTTLHLDVYSALDDIKANAEEVKACISSDEYTKTIKEKGVKTEVTVKADSEKRGKNVDERIGLIEEYSMRVVERRKGIDLEGKEEPYIFANPDGLCEFSDMRDVFLHRGSKGKLLEESGCQRFRVCRRDRMPLLIPKLQSALSDFVYERVLNSEEVRKKRSTIYSDYLNSIFEDVISEETPEKYYSIKDSMSDDASGNELIDMDTLAPGSGLKAYEPPQELDLKVNEVPKKIISIKKINSFIKKSVLKEVNKFVFDNFEMYFDTKKKYFLRMFPTKDFAPSQITVHNCLYEHITRLLSDKAETWFRSLIAEFKNKEENKDRLLEENLINTIEKYFYKVLKRVRCRKTKSRLLTLTHYEKCWLTFNTIMNVNEYAQLREHADLQSSDLKKFRKAMKRSL